MQRALVTGGAGFIGSTLVRALVERGVAVRVLDNFSSGSRDRLRGLEGSIEIVEGDIRDAAICGDACRDVEVVFHLAAQLSVPRSIADPLLSDAVNTGGTLRMLHAARAGGARRFVFSSSSAVYGDTDVVPTPERVLPEPASPYGVQKLAGEHYCRIFTRLYGLPTVSLRYFNVYGPGQDAQSEYAAVIPKFLARLRAGQSPIVFGDGEQTRDFCHVEDVVAANLLAAETTNNEALGGVLNVAGGSGASLNDLLRLLRAATGADLPAVYEAERPGDIRHSVADITRARETLGFSPAVSLEVGLRAMAGTLAERATPS
jgi:UDP-N-acetylglucosamine 4-epimerase